MKAVEFYPIPKEVFVFLVAHIPPEKIVKFKLSDSLQTRAAELTEKNKADTLVTNESIELQQLLEFDAMFMALKTEALVANDGVPILDIP